MQEYLYFISHSAQDKELAYIFYTFLKDVMGLPKDTIFCASITEQIPFGTDDYLKYIRDAINVTEFSDGVLIALITSSFMKSDFCKYEIGAAWIKEIPIKPIFFPPIKYTDSAIQSSPISKTQAVRIDLEDLDETIYNVITNMITDGDQDDRIKSYRLTLSEGEKLRAINRTVKEIASLLQRVEDTRIFFNITRRTCGIYHAQGYSKTLKDERDFDQQTITLHLDFSDGAPPYAGYYVRPLEPKDWTKYIRGKYFLRFDAYASPGVQNVFIEIKCINYQILDKEHKFYGDGWRTYNVYLGDQNPKEGWDDMKEVCFVVKENSMTTNTGCIVIKDLRLERDPRI